MSNPFGKVVGFIKHAAVLISHGFIALFGHDAAAAFGHASEELLKSAAGQIVVKAVTAVESLSPALSGSVKKEQAFSAVLSEAKTQGISVGNSVINMLIELAVQKLQGSFAPAPSTDPVTVKFSENSADPEVGAAASDNSFGDGSSTSGANTPPQGE